MQIHVFSQGLCPTWEFEQSAGKSLRLLISIGQKSEESIDTKTSMFSLGTADDY